jgi:hypothetical protein
MDVVSLWIYCVVHSDCNFYLCVLEQLCVVSVSCESGLFLSSSVLGRCLYFDSVGLEILYFILYVLLRIVFL